MTMQYAELRYFYTVLRTVSRWNSINRRRPFSTQIQYSMSFESSYHLIGLIQDRPMWQSYLCLAAENVNSQKVLILKINVIFLVTFRNRRLLRANCMEHSPWYSTASQDIPRLLWYRNVPCRIHKSQLLAPIFSQLNPVLTFTLYF
jgi:hypothetical protein